jgi:hypothetical protein
MRLNDIITPHDLCKMFSDEERAMRQLGQRRDLAVVYLDTLVQRLSNSYCQELMTHMADEAAASGAFRILCLIDKFLEEKYGHTNTTAD